MREFLSKLEEARALCKLELAETGDPEAVRALRFAIVEIEALISLANASRWRVSKAAATFRWPRVEISIACGPASPRSTGRLPYASRPSERFLSAGQDQRSSFRCARLQPSDIGLRHRTQYSKGSEACHARRNHRSGRSCTARKLERDQDETDRRS